MMKQIVLSLVIGLLIGAFAGHFQASKYDEDKMKESEARIDALTKNLAAEQDNSTKTLARLQAVEDQKKKIDRKIKGDFDELQKTNSEITDVVNRLKAQVHILRKALCDYNSDFCA
jgi:septal ring factor EnvC (AmiA/AmiB activator)